MTLTFADKIRRRILYSHVRENEDGMNITDYLTANFSRFDRAGWREAITQGMVEVNGRKPASPDMRLKKHDLVAYFPGELPEPEVNLDCRVLYCDKDIIVADKPAGLCVHPTGIFFRHTLWNILGQKYGEIHFISRLDRETSGLILGARSREAAAVMTQKSFPVHKEYSVIVLGDFAYPVRAKGFLVPDADSITGRRRRLILSDAPEGKITDHVATVESSPAVPPPEYADTEFIPERKLSPDLTLVRAILHTGRRHQIRASLFSLGFPVAGDKLYGPDEKLFLKTGDNSFTVEDYALLRYNRQALHAAKLKFNHPFSGTVLEFEAPFDLI